MTARHLIAASILIIAGNTYAADAPATSGANAAAAAGATAAATATSATATTTTAAANLNFPVLKNAPVRSRESVRAEAVEAVRNHKTTLAQQLDLSK